MPFENEIVDAGTDDDVAVGRGPTKLETEHHVASGHAQHRTWCDACLKARRIAGRHQKGKLGRGRACCDILNFSLKVDGTEDDNDDEVEKVAQNKLFILVAKDVKTGTYAAICLREKGVS